tara:strand:+ start:5534 stop:6379 length:846 start_codon:yes stop_codon:yes gene_type:complete
MKDLIFDLSNIRLELSFKSFEELRSILSLYNKNNLYKINIPCKNNLKKDFLLDSIKIARDEFPHIDLIPHFSVLHEFKRNRFNTLNSFMEFIHVVKNLGCSEVLLVSGSQKRSTLNSVSTLNYMKDNSFFSNTDFSIGVAFNPYLSSSLFEDEIRKLEKKLNSGLVKSIWLQFGTDCKLLERRIKILRNIIHATNKNNRGNYNINLFGSILIPSKQFLARFNYRPWKGVYCSKEFLESEEFAVGFVKQLLKTYKKNKIYPIIETAVDTQSKLKILHNIFQY